MADKERVTSVLADLVRRESVNPSLSGGQRGEAEVAMYVSDFCRNLGLEVQQQEPFPNRPNVLARLRSSRGHGTLMLEAHTDTVPAGDMPGAFMPRVEGERLYGRGACDTKGSLAAMLHALEQLAADPSVLPCDVLLLAAVSEEDGCFGAESFLELDIPVDAAIVGEPTDLSIITAHKGVTRFRLSTNGRAGHTSTPIPTENAIYQAVEVVRALRHFSEGELADRTHPRVGAATMTVSRFHGGEVLNVVPSVCHIDIDRRTLPGEEPEQVLAEVEHLLAALMAREPWIDVRRTELFEVARGMETAVDHPLVKALQAACQTAGLETSPHGVPYGTDAAMLAGKGKIPCVVFGPGRISEAHTRDEWVSLDQVTQAADILVDTVQRFAPGV